MTEKALDEDSKLVFFFSEIKFFLDSMANIYL